MLIAIGAGVIWVMLLAISLAHGTWYLVYVRWIVLLVGGLALCYLKVTRDRA